MFGIRAPRPSLALVVAILALVVAMGGTSYAAVTLAKNSVLSKHIKNGEVKTPDLKNGAVTGAKVKDGSLAASDFAAGQVPTGPAGPAGPAGATGATGPAGPTNTVTVIASSAPIANGSFGSATATCPAGKQAVGGGVDPFNVFTMFVTASHPMIDGGRPLLTADGQHGPATAWRAQVRNDSGAAQIIKVVAICAG